MQSTEEARSDKPLSIEKAFEVDKFECDSPTSSTLSVDNDVELATPVKRFPETDLDLGIIGWEGQDDPENPQNFPSSRKWGLLLLLSAITFVTPLASSMFSPAVTYVAVDLGVDNESVLSFSVSIFLLGYAFGPFLLAPLSEIYGRKIVLSCANWFFVVWQIGCALAPNITTLIICRLFAGVGGVGCLTLGAGVIADLFPVEKRGLATSIWGVGSLIGPIIGPVIGGFVGENIGWRWVFWIIMIMSGIVSLCIELLNQETYASVLIRRKTARLAKEMNRPDLRSAYALPKGDSSLSSGNSSLSATLVQGLKRPCLLFFKSPIILLLCLYMAFVNGLLYVFFTTIATVFQDKYKFSAGLSGLAFLGIGLGFFLGLTLSALTNDRVVVKLTKRNGGKFEPEMRLPAMIFFSCVIPISFFWYGWSVYENAHWIVPIVGMLPFGFGMMGLFLPIQTYVIDSYPQYAASASAALTASRSLVGALLPLAGPKLFSTLGLGWGNSLLGFIALAFVPVPIIFSRYGQRIRERYPVNLEKMGI